jgi:hypothetical protein
MEEVEGQDRIGVLVISLRRLEPSARLIAQLTAITDLVAEQQAITVPGDDDTVLERVREWMHAVTADGSLPW